MGKHVSLFKAYLKQLAEVDKYIGRLIQSLQNNGLWKRTTLILTADHGEDFSGIVPKHGVTLYDTLLRVPLLVRIPGVEPRDVDDPVSLIDLAPTILDLFELPTPGHFMGQSLCPLFRGQHPILQRPIAAETRLEYAMVFADGIKAIYDMKDGTSQIYDLKLDPREKHNLSDKNLLELQKKLQILRNFFDTHKIRRKGYQIPFRR